MNVAETGTEVVRLHPYALQTNFLSMKAHLGMEEIRDPLKPPTACLGCRKKPYESNKS